MRLQRSLSKYVPDKRKIQGKESKECDGETDRGFHKRNQVETEAHQRHTVVLVKRKGGKES